MVDDCLRSDYVGHLHYNCSILWLLFTDDDMLFMSFKQYNGRG